MPFTFAHPTAIISLARVPLSLSGLIIGSLTPDLPYFVTLSMRTQFGHSLTGIIFFCVPAGLLLLWLWHGLMARPLLELLPRVHQARVKPHVKAFEFLPWSRFLWLVLSLAIGALTHLAWDSLTHLNGWTVQRFSLLRADALGLPIYKGLQYSSGVGGLLMLALWYAIWFRKTVPQICSSQFSEKQKTLLALGMVGIASVVALIFGYVEASTAAGFRPAVFVVQGVLAGVASLFVIFVLYALLWTLVFGKRRKAA